MNTDVKKIIIVGGGISGLSALHYLKKTTNIDNPISVTLLEKKTTCGGTIQTQSHQGALFEQGPNGFLQPEDVPFELADDLGITESICQAHQKAATRYISFQQQLHAVPTTPASFLRFKVLNTLEKLRLFWEPFIQKGADPSETVYNFCRRRFGVKVAEYIADPVISGVFGGDVTRLEMRSAFPSIYVMEQQYGSLLKAMLFKKKSSKKRVKRQLLSFKEGMGQLMYHLYQRYEENIVLNTKVHDIKKSEQGWSVFSHDKKWDADVVIAASPAFSLANMMETTSVSLHNALKCIPYAPIIVMGLVFNKEDLPSNFPEGFGYLNPTKEGKDVLGVLFESHIFDNRAKKETVMLRVMLGGRRRECLAEKHSGQLQEIVMNELRTMLNVSSKPQQVFVKRWEKAIPQYEQGYFQHRQQILESAAELPGFYISANYINGIAFNDCIKNAKETAKKVMAYLNE